MYSANFQVRENLENLDADTKALAEIMVCCGFFLIYFVEEIVHIFYEPKSDKSKDRDSYENW